MREPIVAQRPADALPRFLQRRVSQAHDRETRQPRRDIDLDSDEPAGKAMERCGRDDSEHAPNATPGCSPPGQPPLTRDLPDGYRTRATSATTTGLSTARAKWSIDAPSAESALVNMNGAPELRALIAPRYSLMTS